MKDFISKVFSKYLVSKKLYSFYEVLYVVALKGMGYLNYQDIYVSGETFALSQISNKKNPVIFDVGAADNSDFVAEILKNYPKAKIFGFEPNPSSYQILLKNKYSDNVNYYMLGLGDKKTTLKLYDYKGAKSTQHASIFKENIVRVHNKSTTSHKINIVTLDQFLSRDNMPKTIDFLKIDTEGAELLVLKGARKTLAKNKIKIIQFEFNVMNVYSRVFLRDFIEILPNYTLYKLLPDGMVPIEPYNPWLSEIFSFHNILAIQDK